jgi:hypothetical protein
MPAERIVDFDRDGALWPDQGSDSAHLKKKRSEPGGSGITQSNGLLHAALAPVALVKIFVDVSSLLSRKMLSSSWAVNQGWRCGDIAELNVGGN